MGGDSAVARVTVTGTGTSGLIITGRMQSSPGAGIPAPGIAYRTSTAPARFENISTITFIIPVAWLDEHASPEEIVIPLQRQRHGVEALPTTVERTGGGEATFTATSPGSPLAISGRADGEAVTTPTQHRQRHPRSRHPPRRPIVPAGEPAPEFPLGMIAPLPGPSCCSPPAARPPLVDTTAEPCAVQGLRLTSRPLEIG